MKDIGLSPRVGRVHFLVCLSEYQEGLQGATFLNV